MKNIAPYLASPIRVYDHGLESKFEFIDVGTKEFIRWDQISAVYEYLIERPFNRGDIVHVESYDGYVGRFYFPPNMRKERDKLINVLMEKTSSRWQEIHHVMEIPFFKDHILARHDLVGNKMMAYTNDELDELTYEWGKLDLFYSMDRSFRIFSFITLILILLVFYLNVLVPNTPLAVPDSPYVYGIRYVLLPCAILICITIAAASYLGSPLREEIEPDRMDEATPPDSDRSEDEEI